jgi:hypothetical protein
LSPLFHQEPPTSIALGKKWFYHLCQEISGLYLVKNGRNKSFYGSWVVSSQMIRAKAVQKSGLLRFVAVSVLAFGVN